MKTDKKNRTGVQKAIRVVAILLIIFIVTLAGVAVGAWGYINSMLGKINKETIDTNAIGITEETKKSLKGRMIMVWEIELIVLLLQVLMKKQKT